MIEEGDSNCIVENDPTLLQAYLANPVDKATAEMRHSCPLEHLKYDIHAEKNEIGMSIGNPFPPPLMYICAHMYIYTYIASVPKLLHDCTLFLDN